MANSKNICFITEYQENGNALSVTKYINTILTFMVWVFQSILSIHIIVLLKKKVVGVIIRQRKLLEVEENYNYAWKEVLVEGEYVYVYITCMCEKSSTMFFTMASKFGIEREYIGGLSKAKCLY